MPQQPPITGDAQEDSWSLQVTQELEEIRAIIDVIRQTPDTATLAQLITRLRNL